MIEIKVPSVGESINEVTLLKWTKKDGEYVDRDEVIAELESEKATFEVNAEKAGILKTSANEGDTLKIGDLLASIDESAAKPERKTDSKAQKSEAAPKQENGTPKTEEKKTSDKKEKIEGVKHPAIIEPDDFGGGQDVKASPVASAIIADKKLDPKSVKPSGYQGKILKDDVLAALSNPGKLTGGKALFSRDEKKEKMTQLRKTI